LGGQPLIELKAMWGGGSGNRPYFSVMRQGKCLALKEKKREARTSHWFISARRDPYQYVAEKINSRSGNERKKKA